MTRDVAERGAFGCIEVAEGEAVRIALTAPTRAHHDFLTATAAVVRERSGPNWRLACEFAKREGIRNCGDVRIAGSEQPV